MPKLQFNAKNKNAAAAEDNDSDSDRLNISCRSSPRDIKEALEALGLPVSNRILSRVAADDMVEGRV